MTFYQTAEVAEIARVAQDGACPLEPMRDRLRAVRATGTRFPRPVAVLGSGLQSAGIAVVFRTTWWAVALDFGLALVVGAASFYGGRIRGLVTVLPFLAAFAVSVVVYWLAADLRLGTVTLFVVCAPLVILIPGRPSLPVSSSWLPVTWAPAAAGWCPGRSCGPPWPLASPRAQPSSGCRPGWPTKRRRMPYPGGPSGRPSSCWRWVSGCSSTRLVVDGRVGGRVDGDVRGRCG